MYQFNENNWSVDIAEPQYSTVSLNGDTACFEKNSFAKAIIRYVTKDFEVGKTYRFSVKLNPEKVESVIYPYAIVGFMTTFRISIIYLYKKGAGKARGGIYFQGKH